MCKIFQGFFSFLCEVFSAPIFEGFVSCSVMLLVLAPLKFSRDSFLMFLCLAPLKYSQGVLLFSCPTQIFSRDAFVFFLPPSNIFTGCFCSFSCPPQIFSRDPSVLLLSLLLLLQRLLLSLTTSATFVFSSL